MMNSIQPAAFNWIKKQKPFKDINKNKGKYLKYSDLKLQNICALQIVTFQSMEKMAL